MRDHFYNKKKKKKNSQIPIGVSRRRDNYDGDVPMTDIDLVEHFYRARSSTNAATSLTIKASLVRTDMEHDAHYRVCVYVCTHAG